jgi:hypothetical protein
MTTLKNDRSVLNDSHGTPSSGSAGYEFFLSIQPLYLEQTNQNLQPKERTKGVCNGCWCQQWLIEDPVKQMRSNNNLVKCIFQFFQKLTRIELKYKMVARFTRLPAAIP